MTTRAEPTSPRSPSGTAAPAPPPPAPEELPWLVRALVTPKRASPLVAVYHWRYEILLMVGLPAAALVVDRLIGVFGLLAVVVVAGAAVAAVPALRRWALVRARTVLVQHRLRTAFAQAAVYSPGGRRPAILWARPGEDEVRVLVWCPAGLDLRTVREQRRRLAAACGAVEVAIARHPRYEHVLWLAVRTSRRLTAMPTQRLGGW